jgi:SAM-dependent methyltransferase
VAGIDFSRRADLAELMDAPCDYETFRACLVDLALVNRLTLAARPTIAFFERLRRTGAFEAGRPVRVVDVASGYGDMLRFVARWGRRHGIALDLVGVDLNSHAARAAAGATPAADGIRWITSDVFNYTPEDGIEIVISSLFTHHLSEAEIVRFLAWMERTAALGWLVNDLHRHPLPYHLFRHAARIGRFHRFVQHDGPVSIARAFVREDWQRMIALAGIAPHAARVEWWMPFRLCVSRVRHG